MEELGNLLMFAVPSILVGAIAYLLIHRFMQAESKRMIFEVRKESQKYSLPIRLQAYERVILLLERMEPAKVVNRIIKPGMTAKQIRLQIVSEIINEYDHNITQQLYVSHNSWEAVKKAKEDAIKLVSVTGAKIDPNAPAIEYSTKLLEVQAELEMDISQQALALVKADARKLF